MQSKGKPAMNHKPQQIRRGDERWAPVRGFEGRYEVSDFGRVRSLPRKHCPEMRFLRSRKNKGGYLSVALYFGDGRRPKNLLIHRLVCLAFNGEAPANLPDVNHDNGNKADNHFGNLEWSNDSLNVSHAIRELGAKPPPGCKHWAGKLGALNPKSKPVIRIASDGSTRRFAGVSEAARETSCCFKKVSLVCRGKRPRHAGFHWRFEEIK